MKSKSIDRQAARWFLEVRDGHLNVERWESFEDWIRESPEHAIAYDQMQKTWEIAMQMRRRATGVTATDPVSPCSQKIGWPLPEHQKGKRLSRAASIFVTAIASVLLPTVMGLEPWWSCYHAPLRQPERVRLSDGSELDIKAGAQLRAKVTERSRRVRVLQGEASFRVVHDERRPFEVTAGAFRIRDLGTEFSVKVLGQESGEVRVVTGSVSVASADEDNDVGGKQVLTSHQVAAGEVMIFVWQRTAFAAQAPESRQKGANQNNIAVNGHYLESAGITVGEVVAEFNRYNSLQLKIKDPEVGELRMAGFFSISIGQPKELLDTLSSALSLEYHRDSGSNTVVLVRSEHTPRRHGFASDPDQLSFRNVTLAEAVVKFNRYNNTQIRIGDPEVGRLRLGGSVSVHDQKAFLAGLQLMAGLKIERQTDGGVETVVILRERSQNKRR